MAYNGRAFRGPPAATFKPTSKASMSVHHFERPRREGQAREYPACAGRCRGMRWMNMHPYFIAWEYGKVPPKTRTAHRCAGVPEVRLQEHQGIVRIRFTETQNESGRYDIRRIRIVQREPGRGAALSQATGPARWQIGVRRRDQPSMVATQVARCSGMIAPAVLKVASISLRKQTDGIRWGAIPVALMALAIPQGQWTWGGASARPSTLRHPHEHAVITLSVTRSQMTGWNNVVPVRRMLGLFAFFYVCCFHRYCMARQAWNQGHRAEIENVLYITSA